MKHAYKMGLSTIPKPKTISIYIDRHIFVYLQFGCTVAASERTTCKKGKKTLQPCVNNSLTLNLNLCRKRKLSLGRISLLKRKAQHKRKRIQRKNYVKIKDSKSPVHRAGLFLLTNTESHAKRRAVKFFDWVFCYQVIVWKKTSSVCTSSLCLLIHSANNLIAFLKSIWPG